MNTPVSFELAKLLKEKGFDEYCMLKYFLKKPRDYGIKSIGQSIGVLTVKKLMVNMAKWQSERMYSEEDMREAFKGGGKISWTDIDDFNEWFEQFKKK